MNMMSCLRSKRAALKGLYRSCKPMFWGVSLLLCGMEMTCFRVNESASLPQKYWLGLKGVQIHKGSYVLIQKSQWRGSLIKQVTGVAGDRITRHGSKIGINGQPLCMLQKNAGLKPIEAHMIPEGYVFVSSPSDRGVDSRYHNPGLIAVQDCKAVMWPLPFFQPRGE